MKSLPFLLIPLLVFASVICAAQDKSNPKFGTISPVDFETTVSSVTDSSTGAIILADAGVTTFKGNNKGWVNYVFKHTTRIKILNKRAFELATVKIPIYTGSKGKVALENVSAITYNLENGRVVQAKMDKKDLFEENIDKNYTEYRFTLPGLKENSIIEYTYTINSDWFQYLPSWKFQNTGYPCLWSEYEITIPNLVVYLISKRGIHPYFFDEKEEGHERYFIKKAKGGLLTSEGEEMLSVSANTTKHHWVMRNMPAFNVENYLSSAENYIDKIDFQLYQTSNGEDIYSQRNSWKSYTNEMLGASYFASFMYNPESSLWLDKPLSTITNDNADQLQQAKDIYYYLTNNFTCTAYNQVYIRTSLQDVYKNQKGNVGEINLLLTNMLLSKHITAAPVVFSTRGNGYNNVAYALMERLNYTICKATIGDKVYYLDASRPKLGFGQLPSYCYNGYARVISKEDTEPVYFMADSIKELQTTFVSVFNDAQGKGSLQGNYENSPGYMGSYDLRESINETNQKKYFADMQASAGNEIEITETGIDSLKKPGYPVKVRAGFNIKSMATNDIIYFNPVIGGDFKTNPFHAADRKYPVEMAYPVNQVYILNMETPAGFVIDEIPKSAKVSFNEGDGYFEYLVQKNEDGIQLKITVSMKRAYFGPEEYNSLREFFGYIVKKQSEQIVFKRKK